MTTSRFSQEQISKLHQLAVVSGVQTSYESAFGTTVEAPAEGLIRILNSLGDLALADDLSNLDEVHRVQTLARWQDISEPVVVAWAKKGTPLQIPVRTSGESKRATRGSLTIKLEKGKRVVKVEFDVSKAPVALEARIQNVVHQEHTISLKKTLPLGYHRGTLRLGGRKQEILIISAPWHAYRPKNDRKRWLGTFAPLYALRSEKSWGIGDFSDLRKFIAWAYSNGCDFVGTLPMLSIFNGKPLAEPSPYSPMSRLHWNEMFVDPTVSDEWKSCPEARALFDSADFKAKLATLQDAREVDYEKVAQFKRNVLEQLSASFFAKKRNRTKKFKDFLKIYPQVEDFAAFRAAGEKLGKVWSSWPERQRGGDLQPGDYDETVRNYHVYGQWLAHRQLDALGKWSQKKGRGLYIDFPLSAHADGYDVWRERESFGLAASAGCPPDPAHVHGQDWGILPLNPRSIRRNDYRYFRHCLESHMRYAGMLRLDHVMCFYRLYWVPHGLGAKNGVYIRYRMEEFFALLLLESHRNQCVLIGEDLGTVPPEIRHAMTEHKILRMYVQQRRLAPDHKDPLPTPPEDCICSLNTHDMPPFAAFWQGLDILDKMDLGYFGPNDLPAKQKTREDQKKALVAFLMRKGFLKNPLVELKKILEAVLFYTASTPVKIMQINLEDLWLETLPQNVPGTWKERPNWRRRCRHTVEELPRLEGLNALFGKITQRRRAPASQR